MCRAARRFIPAPAGNTRSPGWGCSAAPVHPRACGEHRSDTVIRRSIFGSSPRLRGTRRQRHPGGQQQRFIPAPAGNTICNPPPRWTRPVHPRACGEHLFVGCDFRHPGGSSPRLRGTRRLPRQPCPRRRFIPAPAGNTPCHQAAPRTTTVHPRACGEHTNTAQSRSVNAGSSPRLRGTPRLRVPQPRDGRFIPAPAGNTLCTTNREQAWTVPSPRLRGTHGGGGECRASRRFIPAPAGNTDPSRLALQADPVHPRACGEHGRRGCSAGAPGGSSPRLRGTHDIPFAAIPASRFIPAPAGNTSTTT